MPLISRAAAAAARGFGMFGKTKVPTYAFTYFYVAG